MRLRSILFAAALFAASTASAATYVVNATDDNVAGPCDAAHCSLREAINHVNADGGGTIHFAIGSGAQTITLATWLPAFTAPVTLDATTQPGYAGTPLIRITGGAPGLDVFIAQRGNTTIRGFAIDGVSTGIWILPFAPIANVTISDNHFGILAPISTRVLAVHGATSNLTIQNNRIDGAGGTATGIQLSGAVTNAVIAGNQVENLTSNGIAISGVGGANLLIGGTTPAARNQIRGMQHGIHIDGIPAGVTIRGNHFGLDGAVAVNNTEADVRVDGGSGIVVEDNVIAAWRKGVWLRGGSGTIVRGNTFGLFPDGVTTVGANTGVVVNGATGTLVGGTTAAERNVFTGVVGVQNTTGNGTTITGNHFGLNKNGAFAPVASAVAAYNDTTGLTIGGTAPGAGNVMGSSGLAALHLQATGVVTVQGNIIGLDPTGTVRSDSNFAGVYSSSGTVIIGGPTPAARNVIGGYIGGGNASGIVLDGSAAATIEGNFIGTDLTGTTARGNPRGISLSTSQPVTIRGNVISGSFLANGQQFGIHISAQTAPVTIENNRIGTNAAGTAALHNEDAGIFVTPGVAAPVTITGNLISGNGGPAVLAFSTGTTLRGNFIGTNAAGTGPIPNNSPGIYVAASGVTIGGTAPGDGNVIAFNTGAGVEIASGTGTRLIGNSIHSNGGLGIDLAGDVVHTNDFGDADTGANDRQNAPVLTTAVTSAGTTTISGTFASLPSVPFTLEFFSSPAADPSGYGEGAVFLGRTAIATDAAGLASFSFAAPAVTQGHVVTATAKHDLTNDTSEFSNAVAVTSAGVVQFSAATYAQSEGSGSVTLTVTRSGSSGVPATVDYNMTNGTAGALDYLASGGTLTFAAAETSKTIVVPIVNDTRDEPDETFIVTLSNPGGASLGTPSTTTVTIVDDEPLPAATLTGSSVLEPDSGVATLLFTVTLDRPSERTLTVDYATFDGTANAGSDYGALAGTLTFAPGEALKQIATLVNGDTMAEADETLSVVLTNGNNMTLGTATATGTILNGDGPPAIAVSDLTLVEGSAGNAAFDLTFTLTHASSTPVTVDYTVNSDTATSGSDFPAASGTVTFAAGTTQATLSLLRTGDDVDEPNETFFVDLSNPVNGVLADPRAVVTLADDDGAPALTISDIAVDETAATATLTVLLAPASAQSVTVLYDVHDGTAAAGADYTDASGTLTFPAGTTTQSVVVPLTADNAREGAETFTVTLSAPVNAFLARDTATVTIIDDDEVPQVSVLDTNAVEGTVATFDLLLSHPSASTVTVLWSTFAGTATGADYTNASGSITFLSGETARTIAVATTNDTLDESDETFFVNISSGDDVVLLLPQAIGSIVDDDGTPSLLIDDATTPEGNAGTSMAAFTVTLAGSTSQTVTVDYSVADGTAVAGSDYAAVSGTLTFFAGQTTQTIHVPIAGDQLDEPDETFFVNLTTPTNATLADNQALGTITDDDAAAPVPGIFISDATLSEGSAGTTNATFTVTLGTATTSTVTVDYATANGTAFAPLDYAPVSGTLVFTPGVTSQTITVALAGETEVEPDETFFLNLMNPVNGILADTQALGTILNDDSAALIPSITISDPTAGEGNAGTSNATFTLTLSAATAHDVTVDYATANVTAFAGEDYAPASGTLLFPAGTTSRTLTVAVAGDTTIEPDELFAVNLSNAIGATIADAQGRATIVNDDGTYAPPLLSIADVTVAEGAGGPVTASFAVTLSAPSMRTVTVTYFTYDVEATAGSDYAASFGTVVFEPGVTTRTIDVVVIGDSNVEPTERFAVELQIATNAGIADGIAYGHIVNDDAPAATPPSLTVSDVRIIEGQQAVITLTLSRTPQSGASVRWATRGGTASAADFTDASGRVTFDRTRTANITIDTTHDTVDEDDETFTLELFEPAQLTLADRAAEVTVVDDDAPAALRAIVLAVGSVQGGAGSRFATSLELLNPTDAPMRGTFVIRPARMSDASRDLQIPYALEGGERQSTADLFAAHALNGLATLDVRPTEGPLPRLSVRIYNDGGATGTTGFSLPVVTPDDALLAGETATLFAPADPVAMRFNVGVRTLDDGATLTIEVRSRDGALLQTTTRDYAANWFHQVSGADFAGAPLSAGDYLVIRVTRGSAVLYGATIDNRTNDPAVEVLTR
ncbi:MAG TPA: Calx-beta domain-containing protein [Thermoanaerobaculia bacterium]